MVNICFDIRTSHLTGVYRYATSALKEVTYLIPQNGMKLYIIHRSESENELKEVMKEVEKTSYELICIDDDLGVVRDSPVLRKLITDQNIELYYTAHYLFDPKITIPALYTVHDLVRLKYPELSYSDETYSNRFGLLEYEKLKNQLEAIREFLPAEIDHNSDSTFLKYFWAINKYLSVKAKEVITVSEASKSDLVKLLGVKSEKIQIIPGSADTSVFYKRNGAEISLTQYKFNLNKPYCLYVGLGHKHKRLEWLLETALANKESLKGLGEIVIVGKHLEQFKTLKKFVDENDLVDVVRFVGDVDDNELAALYSGAHALVVTSMEEGFCLPALEALCCATNVICPNLPVMHETTHNQGHFYDALDSNELFESIKDALTGKFVLSGIFVNPFSWKKSAKSLMKLIGEIITEKESINEVYVK